MAAQHCELTSCHWIVHLKMAAIGNLMLYILPQFLKGCTKRFNNGSAHISNKKSKLL